MRIIFKIFVFAFILVLFVGCAPKQYVIKDLQDLKQSNACFVDTNTATVDLVSSEVQAQIIGEYQKIYFSPWQKTEPSFKQEDMLKAFDGYFKEMGYGANKKKYSESWITKLFLNANVDSYPNVNRCAITIRNTNLRLLPTDEPLFSSFEKLGQDYPFDMLQNSSLGADMPIFVAQISSDKCWVFVESSFASGWVKIEDIAYVSVDFVTEWMKYKDAVTTSDDAKIYDENGNFLIKADIGCKFPLIGETSYGENYKIYIAQKGENVNAILKEVLVRKKFFSNDYLKINMQNAAMVADKLIGQPYGWGGLYGYRDCSAMTRDYFSVFGFSLPRNSAAQAKDKDNYIDLSKLSKKQKKQKIIAEAVPFWTIIWMKGHIMLYIGTYNGEPLVFHNAWGVRVKKPFSKKYINLIGESVITTLEPGKEIFGIKTDILKKVQGMRIVTTCIKNVNTKASDAEEVKQK